MKSVFTISFLILIISNSIWANDVGDRVQLVERANNIPGHPAAGDNHLSHRYPSGTVVTIQDIDASTGWLQVDDLDNNVHWIVSRYIDRTITSTAPPQGLCYNIGSWNIEHFHHGTSRGFPENTRGGPTYPDRSPDDVAAIASAIRDTIDAKILVLNEIMGEEREVDGELISRSDELDDLISELGPTFEYVIASSGRSQRVALLYDTRHARLNSAIEFDVPRIDVQGKDIFSRDPLVGYFTLLFEGQALNDLLVVGLHLASGQSNNTNHDRAMDLLIQLLDEEQDRDIILPNAEDDIMLAGDLNASMFDNRVEDFFTELNMGNWAVLAGQDYPATRLSSVPLEPRSIIDYIIVSRHTANHQGLLGEEIDAQEATVHQGLANNEFDDFRRTFSDHFPVTTCVNLGPDND